VSDFFPNPHLRQLFQRFATYNGSSPYRTPATFNIIPYVESHFGGWYVQGGMAQISSALERLAIKRGVTLCYDREVTGYDGTTVTSRAGTSRPDIVICNGDVLQSHRTWLGTMASAREKARLTRPELACSGYILFLGVRRRYEQLRHHNIFFSENYPAEIADIFERRILPRDPTLYVAISARSEAGQAPPGQDNYFVLVNAPARPGRTRDNGEAQRYRDLVVRGLERRGLENLSGEIVSERIFTSEDFAARDLAYGGSLYGWASHSIRTSLFRPPLQASRHPQLYFVGGTTHPGGGIPLVLLSGRMVAEKILRRR
jgi:phytoene desaturase